MKTYTEEDLRLAFQAGSERGAFDQAGNYFDAPLDEDEYIESLNPKIDEETISFSYSWDKFANALKDEFGESLVEEDGGEEDVYNWWLTDVTVTDIVEFVKNYR